MLEKLAKSIEEINVLAEHYRTCHNVAAIESLAKNIPYPKRTWMLYSGKKEFSAEGFVNPAICVCNRKADRRNASFAGSWVCDCDWHVSFRPC